MEISRRGTETRVTLFDIAKHPQFFLSDLSTTTLSSRQGDQISYCSIWDTCESERGPVNDDTGVIGIGQACP